MNFNLAKDNGNLSLIGILNEMSKLNVLSLREDGELKEKEKEKLRQEEIKKKAEKLKKNLEANKNSVDSLLQSVKSNNILTRATDVLPNITPVIKSEIIDEDENLSVKLNVNNSSGCSVVVKEEPMDADPYY